MSVFFDVASYSSAAIVTYYMGLFLVSLWSTRRTPSTTGGAPFFVAIVPAHDEELVIGQTVGRLRELRGERFLALIMNDGSKDDTSRVAREAADDDPRVEVVDRPAAIAGQGKGEVLNHAYKLVTKMVLDGDPRLDGASADDVVLCIVDADGWLEPHALEAVAPYYNDPRVAGVQLPVRIFNSRDGFLTLMQDLEFVGFSLLVQAGRDVFGSVGLGGNGQFVRLSALQELGAAPWTKCLTEDLDIGLSLVERGWRNRFCPHACVAQQALSNVRAFYRQRTRWIQGHYSCWQHVPALWRARGVAFWTKLDLTLYLMMVIFILVLGAQFAIGLASVSGLFTVHSSFLSFIGDEHVFRAVSLVLSFGPLVTFAITYQRFAAARLPGWAVPGAYLLFAVYGYAWAVPASVRALGRLLLRRGAWVKTPRLAVSSHVLAAEAAALERIA
jgi:cellulose synthase/poly-beta-1,6-N-acetylglucosamine synthase-like glycosyltransferase